ncbi:hypothetical protein ACFYM2_21225 [Streptomyces sp. NPDC006711]|uniref:hypothetical protein n=1 Tax=Streptomyces sp. NPDC006711 TaxID=3364762 RepID=UPI0036A15306
MTPQPAPALAFEEQARGEALTHRIQELQTEPDRWSIGLWRDAAHDAFTNAAAYAEQPR